MSFTIAKRNKKPYDLILLGCFTEFNRFHGHFDNNRYILSPENSTFIGFYPLATETYVMLWQYYLWNCMGLFLCWYYEFRKKRYFRWILSCYQHFIIYYPQDHQIQSYCRVAIYYWMRHVLSIVTFYAKEQQNLQIKMFRLFCGVLRLFWP